MIDSIPKKIRNLYKVSFDIDQIHLINLTATRGKWIDQSQSHNIFIKGSSGKQIHNIYMHAWKTGLKTTYYLRSLAASQIEKSTLNESYGFTQKRKDKHIDINSNENITTKACKIEDPECEACQ